MTDKQKQSNNDILPNKCAKHRDCPIYRNLYDAHRVRRELTTSPAPLYYEVERCEGCGWYYLKGIIKKKCKKGE